MRVQQPVRLGDHSEPRPHVAIVVPDRNAYRQQHPAARDVRLVIEVADTSLRFDRDVKMALQATTGIPHAWLVDLAQRRIVALSVPAGAQYASTVALTTRARVLDTEVDLGGIL